MNRNRFIALAGLLALGLPATARADTFWDFVALNNPAQVESVVYPYGPAYGTRIVPGPGGSVTFSTSLGFAPSPSPNNLVLFKFGNSADPQNVSEKGVGLCQEHDAPAFQGTCYAQDEIGTPNTAWLQLDASGIGGQLIKSFTLSSLSIGETYRFESCTNATFSVCTPLQYVGPGTSPSDILEVAVSPLDSKFYRFGLAGSTTGDYLLLGMTTVPEPGTMGLLATGLVALAGVGSLRRRNRRK